MKAFNSPESKAAVLSHYEVLLNRLTIPYERLNIGTRYGETFILSAGDKENPPLFLLHGSSMNSAMWINDINAMSRQYRVYAPDIPGEPGQSDEEQLPFETEDYTEWLSDVLDGLGIDKTIIVGASLGAWLATKFTVSNPEKVSKLVLLCPAGIGSQNSAFKDIAISLLSKGETGVNELFCVINGGDPVPEAILSYQKLIATSFNARQEPIPTFKDDELRRLVMPCAIFVGGKDIMLRSDQTADRVAKLMPHAEVMVLPDKGHSLTGLADQIMAFLMK